LITYKDHLIPGKPDKPEAFPPDDDVESRLVIIGLAGIKDPLRD
jgi:magnesium-transporting ATPase (P-type)